jgi:uncharacterized delta-60 repeat protein
MATAIAPSPARAHHGLIDPSFGSAGLVPLPAVLTGARPGLNGAIFAAGTQFSDSAQPNEGGVYIARRLASGARDSTFNNSVTGSFRDPLTDVYPTARSWDVHSLLLAGSGSVRVAGTLLKNDGSPSAVFVGGWTSKGFRDGTFAPHGMKVLESDPNRIYVARAAASYGGGYVLAGEGHDPVTTGIRHSRLFWFPTNSAPRTASAIFPGLHTGAFNGVANTGTHIVAVGIGYPSSGCKMTIARFTYDGEVDPSFQGDGVRTIDINSSNCEMANAVDIASEGKIVVAGSAVVNGNEMIAVVRLNRDGSVDSTFGGGSGLRLIDMGATLEHARVVDALPNGDILIAGARGVAGVGVGAQDWVLARLNYDGSSDREFGGSGNGALNGPGHVITTFSNDANRLAWPDALMVQLDGNMVVGGFVRDSQHSLPGMLVRYHAQPGRPRVKVTPVALRRRARVRITALEPAAVTVTLRSGKATLSRGRTSFKRKGTRTLSMPLTPAGRRLTARSKAVTVTATLVARDGKGHKARHQATRTVRR